jgi:hypothetical protein
MRVTINRAADYDGVHALLAGVAVATVNPGGDGCTAAANETNSAATAGNNDALKITWAAIPGAAAYAIFVGTATGAAAAKCEAIVTQTSITLTSLAATGQAANVAVAAGGVATDSSQDVNSYDGIIAQLVAGGSGAYLLNLNNELTGSNGEVLQIQDMFQSLWDTVKVGKFRLLVSGLDSRILTRLGIAASAGPTIYVNPTDPARSNLLQGFHVGSIMNSISGNITPVDVLPWMPGGMIIALPEEIPYPDANITTPFDYVAGHDWERWDYASTATTGPIYNFDVRTYGVLRGLFTGGCGMIYNIFKG